jgi:DNA-binding NarL/FixJ family response regulator
MKALIVDDHPIMRLGVRQLIAGAWANAEVEEAASLEEGCRKVDDFGPEIIVLDLGLPDASGTEGVARMLRVAKETPILVLSLNVESAYAARLLKMGVSGYLPKDRAGDELVTAIERIREGKRYVTAATADLLVEMLGGGKAASAAPHELLSTQEHRVMVLIAAGKTPAQMAEIMHLSVKTIGTYRARILEKTSWKNNVELTKYCVQHGLTDSY